jgi:O-antigen ligase
MNEILYIIFLLSGIIKMFILYFKIPMPVDFTLLSAALLLFLLFKDFIKYGFVRYINRYVLNAFNLLLILFIVIIFSIYYTSSNQYVYVKTIQYITVLLSAAFPFLVYKFSIQRFYKYSVILITLITVLYVPLFLKANMLFMTHYNLFENSPLGIIHGGYLTVGYIIGIALIILLYKDIYIKEYRILLFIFLFVALLTTGARGPLIFLILILIFYIYTRKSIFLKINIKTFLIVGMLFAIVIPFLMNKYDFSDLFDRTFSRLTALEVAKKDSAANDRLKRISYVISKIDTEHILQGYGFGSFGIEYTGHDIRTYPHNIILEILFELGLIGLAVYLLYIFLIIKKIYYHKDALSIVLFIYLFLNSLKSLSLTDSRIMFAFFTIILMIEYKNNIDLEKK